MFCLWQFAATNRKVSGGELPVSFTKKSRIETFTPTF